MEQTNNELNEMRKGMDILNKKLTGEEIVSDDTMRKAMRKYAKEKYGSAAFRIIWFASLVVLTLMASWMEEKNLIHIIIATCAFLIIGFIGYKNGAFRRINTIVDEMSNASIEEMRNEEQQRKSIKYHISFAISFAIFFILLCVPLSYSSLKSGEKSFWQIAVQGILIGIAVSAINNYYFRRNEKKLLNQIDEPYD